MEYLWTAAANTRRVIENNLNSFPSTLIGSVQRGAIEPLSRAPPARLGGMVSVEHRLAVSLVPGTLYQVELSHG